MSNEKQLGLGFMQYSQDYDEMLPNGTQLNYGGSLGAGWGGQIYPYVKSVGVYHCPDDPAPGIPGATPTSPPSPAGDYFNNAAGADFPGNSQFPAYLGTWSAI